MQTHEPAIYNLIEKMSQHFKLNLGNRHLRPALLTLQLEPADWSLIDSVTEKSEMYAGQGMHIDELYERILALARLVHLSRTVLQPKLRTLVATRFGEQISSHDRTIREMTINNFMPNLNIFADMINELFLLVVKEDEHLNVKTGPVHKRMSALKELGKLLTA